MMRFDIYLEPIYLLVTTTAPKQSPGNDIRNKIFVVLSERSQCIIRIYIAHLAASV